MRFGADCAFDIGRVRDRNAATALKLPLVSFLKSEGSLPMRFAATLAVVSLITTASAAFAAGPAAPLDTSKVTVNEAIVPVWGDYGASRGPRLGLRCKTSRGTFNNELLRPIGSRCSIQIRNYRHGGVVVR
jgi:hypothetical protein